MNILFNIRIHFNNIDHNIERTGITKQYHPLAFVL